MGLYWFNILITQDPSNIYNRLEKLIEDRLSADRQYRLVAGSVVNYNQKSQQLSMQTDPNVEKRQSWRSGILRFDAVPLKTLVKELNRYTGKKILIEDTEIMDLKVYATIRIDRIGLALADLELTLPVDVVQHFDRVVIKESDITTL